MHGQAFPERIDLDAVLRPRQDRGAATFHLRHRVDRGGDDAGVLHIEEDAKLRHGPWMSRDTAVSEIKTRQVRVAA
jgi:hypothetical protein